MAAGQVMHSAYVSPTNLPNLQSTQAVDAAAAENFPASQFLQSASALAPTVAENLPAAQLLQAVEPGISENSPCPQSVQTAEEVLD